MNNDTKTTTQTLTEWDSSKATLMRVDDGLKLCKQACNLQDWITWYRALKGVKKEAVVKMSKEEKEKSKQLFQELERKILQLKTSKGQFSIQAELNIESNLDDVEEWLREVMDKKGMLMKNKQTGMDRFTRG